MGLEWSVDEIVRAKKKWFEQSVDQIVEEWNKNKAVYTAILVACGWAGAVISLCKPRNSEIRDRK